MEKRRPGRPKTIEDGQRITFRLPAAILARLERQVEEKNAEARVRGSPAVITLSALARLYIEQKVDEDERAYLARTRPVEARANGSRPEGAKPRPEPGLGAARGQQSPPADLSPDELDDILKN